MIGQILGPVAGLASSWLDAKTTKQAAEAKLKLTEAEAKAKILLSEKTSVADWERIMAENSGSSWKDEFFVIVLSIPLILAFVPVQRVLWTEALSSFIKHRTGIFTA